MKYEVQAVREQLQLLADLQQLDNRMRAFTDEHQQLPQQLQSYEDAYVQVREQLGSIQAGIEHTERHRRALERELEDDQSRLVKTQSRLREVKTNKEYSAVLAEIDVGKQHIAELEDQVLELMEAAEQQRLLSQEYEQRKQDALQELDHQGKKLEAVRQELVEQIVLQDAERQQLVTHMDADLYATYQRLAGRQDGPVAVQVHDGTCAGCHLRIRPQLVSDVRRQETLVTCPHCHRILLWPA